MINRIRTWVEPHAHYAGVVAAAIIFGSWAVTNLLSEAVTRAQQRVGVIANAQLMVDWQRSVDTKLGNLEKLALRGSDLPIPRDVTAISTAHQRLYNWSLELGFVTSFLDDWTNLEGDARFLDGLCQSTGAPSRLAAQVSATRGRIDTLYKQYLEAKKAFDTTAAPLRGGVHHAKVPEATADSIADAAERYRNSVRDTPIEREYIELKNSLLQSESELRKWAMTSLARWNLLSDIFRFVALGLYVVGTLLAIFGKWVEAAAKRREVGN